MDGPLVAMGLPLVVGRAVENIAPTLDESMPGGIAGQPVSTVLTIGGGLLAAGYAVNEIVIKKLPVTTQTASAFLLGGTLLAGPLVGKVMEVVTGIMPTPVGARVVVRPSPVAARVAARPSEKLKLY